MLHRLRKLRFLGLYLVAAWLTLSFAGYAIALRTFAKRPEWLLTSGGRRISGPVSELSVHGIGAESLYQLKVQKSETLTIQTEIAYPLWSGNSQPNRLLADVLRDGLDVTVFASSGQFPAILELALNLPEGRQEKLIDMQDSLSRYGDVRAAANRKAFLAGILAATLLPALFLWRRFLGKPPRA